jgi:hypothetical protein
MDYEAVLASGKDCLEERPTGRFDIGGITDDK